MEEQINVVILTYPKYGRRIDGYAKYGIIYGIMPVNAYGMYCTAFIVWHVLCITYGIYSLFMALCQLWYARRIFHF